MVPLWCCYGAVEIFGKGDIFLFLTDSFAAQPFGNKLAICYNKPAIWAEFYEKSQAAEIVFPIAWFMGTGTRTIVAQELERSSVGIERNDDYVRLA